MNVLSGENFDSISYQRKVVNATNEDDDSGVDVWCEPNETGVWVSLSLEDQKEGPMKHLHDELLAGLGDFRELVGKGSLDLLEVCAPWDAPLSQAVRDAGGKAISIGLHNGFDLATLSGFRKAVSVIRCLKPRYVHFSPPCDPWTAFQNCNQRTEEQVQRLSARRRTSRKLLRNCRRLLEIQLQELEGQCGFVPTETESRSVRHAGGEHPLHAQSWSVPDMRTMARLCGNRFTVHGCQHGMRSLVTGEIVKKPWGWFSTHQGIREALGRVCNHGKGVHAKIQGSTTSGTAIYPPFLCRRFAKALMHDVVELFPIFTLCEHENCFHENEGENELGLDFDEENNDGPQSESLDVPAQEEEITQDEEVECDDQHEPNLEIAAMIRKCHRNLGHPGQESFLRLLRDAGASQEVMAAAQSFQCPDCLRRGRKAPTRPSVIPKVYDKWQCVSIDTFWWKTPREALQDGEKPRYFMGLSMMDEATDFHTAVVIKDGDDAPTARLSGSNFQEAFNKHWLRAYPAPSLLRYDAEGFMRKLEVGRWLETFGMKLMKLEPIAGESAWQLGKHSKHLQTLKEQMNLLCLETQNQLDVHELLSLSVSAKNNMHNIRGYSPNQWAFGQNFSRIGSFLQQCENLPLQSARENPTFEENVQKENQAQRLFLKIDARRRISKALHSKCRPLREFVVGDLIYYFRKGVGEGSRYGGQWFGPARVLAQEKTTDYDEGQSSGSVVWVSHKDVLLRCSPEQLRHCEHDLRHLDRSINGPQIFSDLLQQIAGQQRYLDISQEDLSALKLNPTPAELQPHFRAREKTPLADLQRQTDSRASTFSHGQKRGFEEVACDQEGEGHGREESTDPTISTDHESGRVRRTSVDGGQKAHRKEVYRDLRGRLLQQLGGRTCDRGSEAQSRSERLRHLPSTTSSGRAGNGTEELSRKRPSSVSIHDYEEREGVGEQRTGRLQGEAGNGSSSDTIRGGRGSYESMEQGGGDGRRNGRSPTSDGPDRECTVPDSQPPANEPGIRIPTSSGETRRLRSRSPVPRRSSTERLSEEATGFYQTQVPESSVGSLEAFSAYVDSLDVVEMEFHVTPRDVHCKKGVWVLNAKVKKNSEVILRKLGKTEQQEFEEAMQKEVDSFISSEAVRICTSHGIPSERIMQMRWVLTWKPICDEQGIQEGQKAKARLIVKGFQDPRLLHLPRESPTLSTMGRNLLLSLTARNRLQLGSGDIKTAFLQGSQTELQDQLYGQPPPEVRRMLNMKDHEVLRIVKAVYGLLNAPKQWFVALSQFLIEDGWLQHSLDQCLYKRVDNSGNIVGYIGIHVDDLLCAGTGEEYESSIQRLREKFRFGAWDLAMDKSLVYCGCEIKQHENFTISVKQERFALSIDEIIISNERKADSFAEVTPEERRGMRQALGALNWRATQSAPWLLATVSHLQGCVETATVEDVCSVNKMVRLQRKRFDQGLFFPVVTGPVTLITFTDASWATRKDLSSQGGQITLLVQENMLKGSKSPFCVVSWGSRRLRRVARSSTSAEAQMTGNALDTHEFCKLALYDLESNGKLDLRKTDEYLRQFKSSLVCDARNIFDGIVKVETSGLQMEEKRTAIELLAVKERLKQANVDLKWVDGEQELADGLTKPWKHEPLIKALDRSEWRIIYDPAFQSARRKRALGIQNVELVHWLHCLFALEH